MEKIIMIEFDSVVRRTLHVTDFCELDLNLALVFLSLGLTGHAETAV